MKQLSILTPVYNGEASVGRALDSALAQTGVTFQIIVSLDPSTDDSRGVVGRYADHPDVHVIAQPQRLGWVGNSNALFDRVDTPYLARLDQDDQFAPDHARRLIDKLEAAPNAVSATSLIVNTDGSPRRRKRDTVGSRYERMRDVLLDPLGASDLKGVMRAGPFQRGLRLRPSPFMDYKANRILQLELAREGDHLYLDEPLFIKAADEDTLSAKWAAAYTGEEYFAAEVFLRATLVNIILEADLSYEERHELIALVMARLDRSLFQGDLDDASWADWPVRLAAGVLLSRVAPPPNEPVRLGADARRALAASHAMVAQMAHAHDKPALSGAASALSLALDRDNANALKSQARHLISGLRAGVFPRAAVESAQRLAAHDPTDSQALELLARAHVAAGDLDSARATLAKAEEKALKPRASLKKLSAQVTKLTASEGG